MTGADGLGPTAPRVLVLLGSIPLYGLELASIDVGCMLRDAGADVLFVTNAHWGHVAVEPRLDALGLRHEGVVFFGSVERGLGWRRLLALLRLQASENLRLWRIMRRFRPSDVHLASHWDAFNLWPALWASRSRLTLQVHNVPDARHPLSRGFWRVLLRRCTRVVAVSRRVADTLAALGADPARIAVVPNRPPLRPLSAPGERVEIDRLARTVFAFVGQVAALKGVAHLVEAIERLAGEGHDIACHVVGAADTGWARALAARVASGPAQGRVVFHGYQADPSPWLRAADVLVAPSLCDEAYGMVVTEAKAARRAAVVYDDGALREQVRDGVDGRVVPRGDIGALVAALRQYAEWPALAATHGEAAWRSLSQLGIDQVPARWTALYTVAP